MVVVVRRRVVWRVERVEWARRTESRSPVMMISSW
jgi:hypothetical protein